MQLPLLTSCYGCSSVKRAAAQLGERPINVLVNNASVAAPKGDLGKKTIDGFEVGVLGDLSLQLLMPQRRMGLPSVVWHV